ncbi:hypothetical protein JHK82_039712 [Glycine max]|uniref:RNase H type-1 domain-containing protein n=2 Tax=Glycine subgen. Soja TaxID=1462606 RepID=A0A0R0GQ06_SOYBN|nr:hypothetical protein JHK87_039692 [Glycine soja]KAG4963038.1 hypothetical protein JHK86_039906 [Glycine max]KAG4965511.1 hypothetical protein JHK85_040486 [Glycine max]KAG5110489.1 hypothetical protein JHK82_039712 [Glycine max]KAG5121778.1 hypothetical protein JHK84_040118 [Glycine max]
MFIPLFEEEDRPVWEDDLDRNCSLLAKTLVLCKFMQNKLPTDDMLRPRSCNIISRCDLWYCSIGNADHLMLQCSFASKVRDWLEIKLQHKLDQNSMLNILGVLNFDYSPQLHDVRLVTINYIVWSIWDYRIKHVLFAEISAVITTIEIAHEKGWRNLWLECDSLMVVQDFKDVNLVPWSLRNTWRNAVIRLEI